MIWLPSLSITSCMSHSTFPWPLVLAISAVVKSLVLHQSEINPSHLEHSCSSDVLVLADWFSKVESSLKRCLKHACFRPSFWLPFSLHPRGGAGVLLCRGGAQLSGNERPGVSCQSVLTLPRWRDGQREGSGDGRLQWEGDTRPLQGFGKNGLWVLGLKTQLRELAV